MSNIATTAASVKKQFTFGVTENHKNLITELRGDFTRPAAVKNAPPVIMSEKEALEVLYTVATDRRFKVEVVKDENGGDVYDADGILEMKTVDLFETAWNDIKARDYSDSAMPKDPIAALEASIRKYGKSLNLTAETIENMIASAKGTAAPVEA